MQISAPSLRGFEAVRAAAVAHPDREALPPARRNVLIAITLAWLVGTTLAGFARLTLGGNGADTLPYALLAICPVIFLWGALAVLGKPPSPARAARGSHRLFGRWQALSPEAARSHRLYGVGGWMLSLVGGLLVNVLVRAAEFYVVLVPLNEASPGWYREIFNLVLFDFLLFAAFYLCCFAAAIRHASTFPLMLCLVWAADVLVLLALGAHLRTIDGVPPQVVGGFGVLIDNNVLKTAISCALWFPYLIFSNRVQITFHHRLRTSPFDRLQSRAREFLTRYFLTRYRPVA